MEKQNRLLGHNRYDTVDSRYVWMDTLYCLQLRRYYTMLDSKHRNIGATIGLLTRIHKVAGNGEELPVALTELFMLEADDCDYKHETGACIFNGSTKPNQECMVGNCPLGPLVDEELKSGANSDAFGGSDNYSHHSNRRIQLYGKNTMNGENTMNYSRLKNVGYAGWCKYWNMFKEWPSYLFCNWKTNLLIVIGVFAVYYGSALVGHISGTYF
jgi:hypothetical protein